MELSLSKRLSNDPSALHNKGRRGGGGRATVQARDEGYRRESSVVIVVVMVCVFAFCSLGASRGEACPLFGFIVPPSRATEGFYTLQNIQLLDPDGQFHTFLLYPEPF